MASNLTAQVRNIAAREVGTEGKLGGQALVPGVAGTTGYAELPVDPMSLGILRLAKPCTQYDISTTIQTALGSVEQVRRRRVGGAG